MDSAAARVPGPPPIVFRDGLGERRRLTGANGRDALEVLCVRHDLAAVPAFEFALRERVSRVAAFRHAYFAPARSVERLTDTQATLALVSDHVAGTRLIDVLANVERRGLRLDINAALCLVRQLVPAIAVLHEQARDVAHGALGPERLVLTPHARLVIVEHVLGGALEQLRFSHERYWRELRIPLPRCAGLPRFEPRADVMQAGAVALALILGRPLREDEAPSRLSDVLSQAAATLADGSRAPLSPALRAWLARALHVDLRDAFETAADAGAALEQALAESDYVPDPAAVSAFVERYEASEPAAEAAAPVSVSAAPAATPRQPVPIRPVAVSAPSASEPESPSTAIAPAAAPAPIVVPTPVAAPAPFISAPVAPVLRPAPVAAASPAAPKELPAPAPFASAPAAKPEPAPAVGREIGRDLRELLHDEEEQDARHEPTSVLRRPRLAAAAIALVAIVAGGAFGARRYLASAAPAAATGTVAINTNPPGAALSVDGAPHGVTPQTLTLNAGDHVIELHAAGAEPRSIPIAIAAGAQLTQYIELPKGGPSAGELQVRTEPAGARVSVDGVARGASPVTVSDLPPGEHAIEVTSELGTVKHSVTVEAGATASVVIPLVAADGAPVSGWVTVSAPVGLQLFEKGQLIGTSAADRIMMSAGSHQIDLVNDAIGYRVTRTVQVTPGRVTPIGIKLPTGTVSLNAVPWADVWIDGVRVGETPIGNLTVTAGQHDIVFRHPELGERHETAVVTLTAPLRLSVDMRNK